MAGGHRVVHEERELDLRWVQVPADIIGHAVWLYYRFSLSLEDLLAERGIIVSHETIHQWCLKFGGEYARRLKKRRGRLGDVWFVDEVFMRIQGRQMYLWRPWTKMEMSSTFL